MTIAVDHRSHRIGRPTAGSLARLLGLGYGVAVYAIFLATLLNATGFIGGVVVPKHIDSGTIWPSSVALVSTCSCSACSWFSTAPWRVVASSVC
jgi:methanethiol S-methyltransferase